MYRICRSSTMASRLVYDLINYERDAMRWYHHLMGK